MPQSFASIIVQIVFSTKDRIPWLDDTIRPRLHAYLATVGREVTDMVYAVMAWRITFPLPARCRKQSQRRTS